MYNYMQIQNLPGEERTYRAEDEGDQDELRNCGADKIITLKVNNKLVSYVYAYKCVRCQIESISRFFFFLFVKYYFCVNPSILRKNNCYEYDLYDIQ